MVFADAIYVAVKKLLTPPNYSIDSANML